MRLERFSRTGSRGIAMILVMVVIIILGVLAGGFAYSMKVETRLAHNHLDDAQIEWLGRAGVELARYVVGQQLNVRNEPYDALNQKWAGGIGNTNELLADIELSNYPLGSGNVTVKMVDYERKFNINRADIQVLQQAFTLLGGDVVDSSAAVDSILDWCDPDDDPHLSGAESDYYLGMSPPYVAKNGPVDDLTELLIIQGITPELYWGLAGSGLGGAAYASEMAYTSPRRGGLNSRSNRAGNRSGNRSGRITTGSGRELGFVDEPIFEGGLVDLFVPLSSGLLNINTAGLGPLQLIPGVDATTAQQIIQMRSGPDGTEGNEDDMPFRSPGELVNVPGINRQFVGQLARFCTVRSSIFEVQVQARIGTYQREFVALLRRNSARDVQTLSFRWK